MNSRKQGDIVDKTEEALRASEERFRQLADSALEGLFIYDRTGKILDANLAALRIAGLEHDEAIGRNLLEFVAPESLDVVLRHMGMNYDGPLEVSMVRKDGTQLLIEGRGSHIVHGGTAARVVAIRDISGLKRMEEALRKSEAMYRMITDNMTDTIWLMDMDLKTTWISPSVERNRGFSLEEIRTLPLEAHLTPASLRAAATVVAEELTPERLGQGELAISRKTELEFYRKDGTTFWSEVKLKLIRDQQGNPAGLLGVGRDIQERKLAEEALRQSEERFSTAFHMSPVPTTINRFDDGRYLDVNDSFLRMLGYARAEVVGRTIAELGIWDREDHRALVRKLHEQGFVRDEMLHLVTKTGERRDVLNSCELMTLKGEQFVLSIGYDVTEQRRLERQLRRSQKLEAVGTLAGGIAHDFNNILGAVTGYTEIALREAGLSPRLKRCLDQVQKAGERATHLVQQILTFSRQTEEKAQPMRISPVITEVLQLLRTSLPATIRIRPEIQSDPDTILADPTQIYRILMNLCTNAAHSLREGTGELTVRLTPLRIEPFDSLVVNEGLTPGMYLNLAVGDTGCGIDPAILDRIFDPFFTTKQPGEGIGMGLAVVHGIVRSYRGAITVKSAPGVGTEFNVYLPLLTDGLEGDAAAEAGYAVVGGKECILFVDDEEVLVEVGIELLAGLGYEVVGRTSSLEALELFRACPDRFDLVIADITMPNMTGIELCREITQIQPQMPVILCSGFSEAITAEQARTIGVREFIMKPIVLQQLAPAIRRALDPNTIRDPARSVVM
ncbi:MAG: PAS domain-containing hybrid sensor histidine kinase/response regulator [Syntrophales bacterium]